MCTNNSHHRIQFLRSPLHTLVVLVCVLSAAVVIEKAGHVLHSVELHDLAVLKVHKALSAADRRNYDEFKAVSPQKQRNNALLCTSSFRGKW